MKLLLYKLLLIPVLADSGLDAKYDGTGIGEAISSLLSLLSPVLEMLVKKPGDTDYQTYHIIMASICIILFYTFMAINLYKLYDKKFKVFNVMLISLIPTISFGLCCFFVKLPIIIYLLMILTYIITYNIITNIVIKKRLKRRIEEAKSLDKNFDLDTIYKDTFNIYKDIQIAWMNSDLKKLKSLISKEIYEDYEKKLDKLKKNNQKNIMDRIEFKKAKLIDLRIEDNLLIIAIKLNVNCIDYIINDKEKVVKGKDDKINKYTYKLTFNKKINSNKYVLVKKKIIQL